MDEFDESAYVPEERFFAKLKRKSAENPFMLGALGLTLVAMGNMTRQLLKGDKTGFNHSQRYRVMAQIFAIGVFAGGMA
ncbi:hypothetical protein HK097_004679 [Rhizophlyctis rosea]|uniref:HIG1 domain-containing protein n=1 Tax=Rhizophlyctis rosea TaxID=64517 RepID=A0AAD5S8J6_9FUNG|nr:hypothetical protein HK097_004679 [Rhizophlyctis rosea]